MRGRLVLVLLLAAALGAWWYERHTRRAAEATLDFHQSVLGVTGGAAIIEARQACSNPVDHASPAYIAWCLKYAPNVYPACYGARNSPRDVGGGPAYLEVLDCSWHAGKNPREQSE